MNIERKTVTTAEAAVILGHPPATLKDWRLRGVGPRYLKQGRSVRYKLSMLEKWQDQREHGGTHEYVH
jgi:hypothetical protein